MRETKGKAQGNPYRYKITVGGNGVLCQYTAQNGGSLVEGGVSWCFEREGLMYEYNEGGGGSAFITIREGSPGQATVLGVMLNEMGLLGQSAWIQKIANGVVVSEAPVEGDDRSSKLAIKWPFGYGDVFRHREDPRLLTGSILHTGSVDFPQLVTQEYGAFFRASEAFTLPREVRYSYKGPQASQRSIITLEKVEFMKQGETLPDVRLPPFGIAEVADVSHMGPGQGEVRYKVFDVLPTHAEVQKLRQDSAARKEITDKMEWLEKAQQSVPRVR